MSLLMLMYHWNYKRYFISDILYLLIDILTNN
jgi:hypothetical protein